MPPKAHATLSASSAMRWMSCPPSARLCENYEDKGSDFAAEGTDAHALCEYLLQKEIGIDAADPTGNLAWYSSEMQECADGYAAYIMEQYRAAKELCGDPVMLIEQRVDFSRWVPDGFGTSDCIIVSDDVLTVADYKHGQGVGVSAEDNPQMKLYALGALEIFDGIYDISEIRMIIYQPRKSNISVWNIEKDKLLEWAETDLVPAAKLAYDGKGEFNCGEWCRFCKAKTECRERAIVNLELAKYDFDTPATLSDEEISEILGRIDELTAWAADFKEFALQKAISGKAWTGWKLVEGRSNRKYTDETVAAEIVSNAGFDPYEKKILGITAMQKLLGKTRFEKLLKKYIEKPQGKPTLVPDSDERPAMNTAKNDFMEDK